MSRSSPRLWPRTSMLPNWPLPLRPVSWWQGHWDTVTDIQTTLLHLWRSPSPVCVTWKSNLVILIIMYIYHALINALSTHIMHINLNTIYVRRGQSYQNNLHKALYGNTHMHARIHACIHARTHARTHTKNDCNRNWVLILVEVEILWAPFIALKHIQAALYLMRSEVGSQCSFSRRGVEWWWRIFILFRF